MYNNIDVNNIESVTPCDTSIALHWWRIKFSNYQLHVAELVNLVSVLHDEIATHPWSAAASC
jgi:hypothetical protein